MENFKKIFEVGLSFFSMTLLAIIIGGIVMSVIFMIIHKKQSDKNTPDLNQSNEKELYKIIKEIEIEEENKNKSFFNNQEFEKKIKKLEKQFLKEIELIEDKLEVSNLIFDNDKIISELRKLTKENYPEFIKKLTKENYIYQDDPIEIIYEQLDFKIIENKLNYISLLKEKRTELLDVENETKKIDTFISKNIINKIKINEFNLYKIFLLKEELNLYIFNYLDVKKRNELLIEFKGKLEIEKNKIKTKITNIENEIKKHLNKIKKIKELKKIISENNLKIRKKFKENIDEKNLKLSNLYLSILSEKNKDLLTGNTTSNIIINSNIFLDMLLTREIFLTKEEIITYFNEFIDNNTKEIELKTLLSDKTSLKEISFITPENTFKTLENIVKKQEEKVYELINCILTDEEKKEISNLAITFKKKEEEEKRKIEEAKKINEAKKNQQKNQTIVSDENNEDENLSDKPNKNIDDNPSDTEIDKNENKMDYKIKKDLTDSNVLENALIQDVMAIENEKFIGNKNENENQKNLFNEELIKRLQNNVPTNELFAKLSAFKNTPTLSKEWLNNLLQFLDKKMTDKDELYLFDNSLEPFSIYISLFADYNNETYHKKFQKEALVEKIQMSLTDYKINKYENIKATNDSIYFCKKGF